MLQQPLREDFLHYLWKVKKIPMYDLKTTDGQHIEILDFGWYNTDAGPDFTNVKLRIGNTLWAGNVEMHLQSSDWYKHRHERDPAYDNVILHVVYNDDEPVWAETRNAPLPTLELKGKIPLPFLQTYLSLSQSQQVVPCKPFLKDIPEELVRVWIESLAVQRLSRKAETVDRIYRSVGGDWEETTYILLARYMGAKVNMDPFEMVARKTPLQLLSRNRHNSATIEALLFGQAGMLHATYPDAYFQELKREYAYLRRKYQLTPMDARSWKFSRMRPEGFPTLRMAQFASMLAKDIRLFSQVREGKSLNDLKALLYAIPSAYWQEHYRFGKESVLRSRPTGDDLLKVLTSNVCAPIMHYYSLAGGDHSHTLQALSWLEALDSEQNKITRLWQQAGLKIRSGFDSQALHHLYTEYCLQKKCLSCRIGHEIVKKE